MSPDVPPTRVVLVRHGESNVTVRRVVGGPRTCDGLSELGREQAGRLRDRLADTGEIEATHLVSSAYPRAQQTAEVIAPVLGLDVAVDAGFGEHDPGPDCDGMTFQDFVERFGMPDWESDPHAVTFPGGETIAEFDLRVGATFSRTLRGHHGGTIVIVCHGGVIDGIVRTALRAPRTGVFELHTKNASLTEIVQVRPDRWRLIRYNDAAHLAGLPPESPRTSDG
ncbi:MAG: histidine phosphatase family protein [Acidimicrobiia bacterium]